jgi:hypothetical protein
MDGLRDARQEAEELRSYIEKVNVTDPASEPEPTGDGAPMFQRR